MKNYIKINGVNSNTINGLGINELPPISKPPLRVQTEEIDGRDGDISTNLGYGAYDKTISIGLFGTGYDINEVISFFNGEGTVVFSNEPNKYYKYKIINQIDYEALLKFKSATITFHCQPFKYPLTETPLEIEYEYIEQEGVESATMNNTNGGTSLKIDLKGNTSQYTTTGKNILDTYSHGNTATFFTCNKNGSITFNGTPTTTNTNLTIPSTPITLNAGTYTFSSNIEVLAGTDTGIRVWLKTAIGAATITNSYYGHESNSFTLSETTTIFMTLSGTNLTSKTYNNVVLKPMIRTTGDDTWEPYTGNQPSPSPSYPQPINVVSGDNTIKVEGKNLFDMNWLSSTNIAIQDNVATGTALNFRDDLNPIPYTNYGDSQISLSISAYTDGNASTSGSGLIVRIYYDDNSYTGATFSNSDTSKTTKTLVSTLNKKIKEIRFAYSSGGTNIWHISEVMVNSGDTALPYEPYQSQTYPINLPPLGKNKFDVVQFEKMLVTGKILNDSGVEITDSTSTYSKYTIPVKANTTYYIKGWFQRVYYYNANGEFVSRGSATNNLRQEAYTPTSDGYIGFQIANSIWEENKGQEQVEIGDSATTYEAYNGMELCKIGDYQDYFYKASGKWYKHSEIGKYILNGTENWQLSGSQPSTGRLKVYYTINSSITKVISDIQTKYNLVLCNLLTSIENASYGGGTRQGLSLTTAGFNVCLEAGATLQGWKDLLSSSNMITCYPIETPTNTEITDNTLIGQLEAIKSAYSYDSQTNINQDNNDLPFIISAKAMKKDTNEVVINNIGNVYAKPTIALEGTGETDIYLNNTEILKVDLSEKNKITIDTNNMEAYDPTDNSLANRKVIGNYNSMTLPSGNTTMKITGALTKATITNYSRWL